MYIYQSMTHVTVAISVTVAILLAVSLKRNPLHAAGSFVQELFTSGKYLIHFAVMIGILFFNKVEQAIERQMNYHGDFTSAIHGLEGNIVPMIQKLFRNEWLTHASTFFYVVVFTAVMVTSIGVYTYERKHKLFYAVCYAIMFNYLVAIPFYLFFPVYEVWSYMPDQVSLLMHDVFPTFEQVYRPLSGLDNCFPSLHTSISVSMAVIAGRSDNVFWRWFTRFSAAFIMFSIFYLGVHWVTDMCGGVVLGYGASKLALRLSEGRLAPHAVFRGELKSRQVGD